MNTDLHNAYKTHQRSDETIRETEAHALLSCASRLETARQADSSKEFFADALRHNQQLWTLFQACLCDPTNPLPKDLKVLLLNLSCYVDKVTFRALGTNDRALLNSLININRTIAAGLRVKTEEASTTTTTDASMPTTPPEAPMSVMTSA